MALPLLALGARMTASQGVRAGATQAVRRGATQRAAAAGGGRRGGGIGFMDMMDMKGVANNVIDFKTGKAATRSNGMSMGGSAPAIAAPAAVRQNTNVAGDIQAATELSMDELAKQTKILQDIQENTQQTATNTQSMVGSGAAAAIPSTPDDQQGSSEQGVSGKLLDSLAKLAPAASIGLGGLAGFGLAQIGTGPAENEQQEQVYDVLESDQGMFDRIGANTALSDMFGTRRGIDNVSSEELEANQAKREQIVKRIERAGLDEKEQERQIGLLDRYLKRGQVDKVQDISSKYRLAGDEEDVAYQYRFGKMDMSQAEDYAETTGNQGAIDKLEQARTAYENDPEALAKAEQEFVDSMNKARIEFDKRYSSEMDKRGQYGLETAAERSSRQIEKAEDLVAAKFGNEGFFGGLMESGSRFFSSEETDQEALEKGVKAKLARIRANMEKGNASEKQIQTQMQDELSNIQQMSVGELEKYIKTDDTSTEKLQQQMQRGEEIMRQEEAERRADAKAATAASMAAAAKPAAGGTSAGTSEPTVTTAIVNDPSSRDTVGRSITRVYNQRALYPGWSM